MILLAKQFFYCFLVLIMIISPVQVSMAADFDQHDHAPKCQMNMNAEISIGNSMGCAMQHDEHCQEHAGCVGQFHSSSLQNSHSFLSASRASNSVKFISKNDTILNIYHSLLKRPPKA